MKRIFVLLLAVLTVCALTVPAFAMNTEYDVIVLGSSTFSQGSIIIAAVVAAIAVLAVIYFAVRSKKNKK